MYVLKKKSEGAHAHHLSVCLSVYLALFIRGADQFFLLLKLDSRKVFDTHITTEPTGLSHPGKSNWF